MVYSSVYLINGVIIDQIKAYQYGYVNEDGEILPGCTKLVHGYCCHSKISKRDTKIYVYGNIIHIFHRVKITCGKLFENFKSDDVNDEVPECGEKYTCDDCLGVINGGTKRQLDIRSI